MAREFGKILTSLWQSQKMRRLKGEDLLKDRSRLFYTYLHTSKHGNCAGCYVLDPVYAGADLGWSDQVVHQAIDSLVEVQLIGWDDGEMVVRIVDFIKHDPPQNKNHASGMRKALEVLPNCEQKQFALADLSAIVREAEANGWKGVSKRFEDGQQPPNPIPNPVPKPIPSLSSPSVQTSAREKGNGFVLGRDGNGTGKKFDKNTVSIKDPLSRIAVFQKSLMPFLGPQPSLVLEAAMRPSCSEYARALQLCQNAAERIGKGWPHNWPNLEAETAA